MGKLGKKARKFAKKNLQSVLRNRRKFKAKRDSFKRKSSSSTDKGDSAEDHEKLFLDQLTGGNTDGAAVKGVFGVSFLDGLFSEEDDTIDEASGSDGYLSEDPECPYISQSENEIGHDEKGNCLTSVYQNSEVYMELTKQKKTLDRLKKKDPKFSEFLQKHRDYIEQVGSEEPYSDEEFERTDKSESMNNQQIDVQAEKIITGYTVDVWCWLVMEQPDTVALSSLLNGYRTACHCSFNNSDDISQQMISNREVFSKLLIFVLNEADSIFRRLLGVSESCRTENISKLNNTSQWKTLRPLIKSYLRSTLFLLNQLTDSQILVFALSRLRASIIFFTDFPLLAGKLIKIAVQLWASSEESLFLTSFLLIRDMALGLGSDFLDICLTNTYRAFISCCKLVEPANLKHIEQLGDSVVELYSFDVQKSYEKVLISLQQLANTLQCALKTKKKEELKKVYNWQYTKCIDIWVKFILANIRDYDLQPLLYLVIQIIKGVAHLFPGPRYLPLKLKCVQMLNQLSSSSGVFIPIAYLVLDFLEYQGSGKTDTKPGKAVCISSVLKAPKQWLKSRDFQEECILSAVVLLSVHFSQWSYHISFPDLATIPLIFLRRFYERTTVESVRRSVKRLIDQVEQNVEFVQRKRDEASISPNDQTSIESFLQLEKSSKNAPFTMFYNSIQQKSLSRNI